MPTPELTAAVAAADTANKANLAALVTLGAATAGVEANWVAVKAADAAVFAASLTIDAAVGALEQAQVQLRAAAESLHAAAGSTVSAAGKVTTANGDVQLAGKNLSAAGIALATLAVAPPPVVPPVVVPPVVVPPVVTPVGYGAPMGTALKPWQFAMVTGGGAPAGVGPWKKGARISGVKFQGIESKVWYADLGICTGQIGDSEDVILEDSVIDKASKWHGRIHRVKGTTIRRVSNLNGPEEHDWYIEPLGGQALTDICFLLQDGFSSRCGSQRFQSAQRSEDGITAADYVDGGMIVIRHDKCVDHARHASEGGTGTRQSQAYKVFSAQVGPDEAHRVNRMLKHYVLYDRIDLDDSMQTLSHGFGLIGACLGAVIVKCKAKGGSLSHPSTSMEALRVESFIPGTDGSQVGPLLIEGCEFNYTSGSGGPGIALLDKRPVLIKGCTGNLRVQNAAGATIGMVKDGFSQNWTAAAQATVDKIKLAGGV